jgi:hypothetical protein
MYGRLAALPNAAEPLQRSQLMAALAVGTEIIQLRHIAPRLGLAAHLDAALEVLARGSCAIATTRLTRLDERLASLPGGGSGASLALQARGSILAISEALFEHGSYFDAGAPGFTEIDVFGVYVAPMSLMMVAAWFITITLRRVASRFGLLRHVWHPALFVFAVYMIVLSSITLIVAR